MYYLARYWHCDVIKEILVLGEKSVQISFPRNLGSSEFQAGEKIQRVIEMLLEKNFAMKIFSKKIFGKVLFGAEIFWSNFNEVGIQQSFN